MREGRQQNLSNLVKSGSHFTFTLILSFMFIRFIENHLVFFPIAIIHSFYCDQNKMFASSDVTMFNNVTKK